MKASSSRKTLLALLGATFVTLTALVIWRPGLEGPDRAIVSGLAPGSIERVAIGGPKASTVALRRRGDHWVITAPALLPPNPTQLEDVLAVTRARSRASYPLSELGLEATGLGQPDVILSADDVDLEFGGRAPVSGDRYVRVGQQIHLVANAHYHTLTRPLDDYVAARLLPEQERLQTIRLPGFTLRRVAEDRWEFHGDASEAMEATGIAQLWETAAAAALQLYSPTLNSLGRVELLREGTEQPIAFDILQIPGKPDFILGRQDAGLQYHFAPELGRQLLGMEAIYESARARTP